MVAVQRKQAATQSHKAKSTVWPYQPVQGTFSVLSSSPPFPLLQNVHHLHCSENVRLPES